MTPDRRLRERGQRDAALKPPPTDIVQAWQRRPTDRGPLWRAACWQVAAATLSDPERRADAFTTARRIMAEALGEIPPSDRRAA